ncbi:MBOAT family protein [Myxococcota bacterium]|nr:MBOAT family protein [Myxococcota bacterium]MBU1411730.1 MBOAT family protein [Myxococcota bacterium]MBU1509945.1 MBOAT family protein [Myxococcota bacterium]
MIFSSFPFIFMFLPISLIGYFLIARKSSFAGAKLWLVAASLFFYGYWNWHYVPLILISCLVNFHLGVRLMPASSRSAVRRKRELVGGIVLNLAVLGFFKYTHFLVRNLEWAFSTRFDLMEILLPLAISFFTFQQIAYLVDSYRGTTRETEPVNYLLFVTFFPQLIAGPIVHHAEVIPQFEDENRRTLSWDHMSFGLYLFAIGLFKKVVIADSLSLFVGLGFDSAAPISMFEAWIATLAFTLQLYFDFSGYTDMGLGAARMFNIELPQNFLSPYKSRNIQEFWRRWHITLSRWLMTYLYIPLGGSKAGHVMTLRNLMITFVLGGLWHGAGWTFVLWGVCHGAATVVHRIFSRAGHRLPFLPAWIMTFLFAHLAWVLFRATSFSSAMRLFKAMFGLSRLYSWEMFYHVHIFDRVLYLHILGIALLAVLFLPNSRALTERLRFSRANVWIISGMLLLSFLFMNSTTPREFLYFDF